MTSKQPPPLDTEDSGLYPIRTVSSLTGVNPITLRAWERRYGLIRPQRTPKGHRLYTKSDVERIQQVLRLLNQGIAISQVKPLVATINPAAAQDSPSIQGDEWRLYQQKILAAIERFDEGALDRAYNDALSLYPVELVLQHLVNPTLQHLGMRWKDRPAGIAEEHFFSVFLRNKIGSRIQHLNTAKSGPELLISCLPGEYHEIGMLLFALAAVSHGYRVLVFGASLPLSQIAAALENRSCDGIVLSGSTRAARGLLDTDLPALVKNVTVPVFVGGAITQRHTDTINATGALAVGHEFPPALKQIADRLGKGTRR